MELTTKKLSTYETINVMVAGFLLIYLVKGTTIFLLVSIALSINNLVLPRLNELIVRFWHIFGEKLGRINSTVILSLVYFFILTPTGILFRMFNPSRTNHFNKIRGDTYFIKLDPDNKIDFTKQW